MVSAQDLLRLTVEPDLDDGKCERTLRLCQRLTGQDQKTLGTGYDPDTKVVDYSGCLQQRIGPVGQTALHMAIDRGNHMLAQVLTNNAAGGKAALVVSMDDKHRTPWSIAVQHLCFDPIRHIKKMDDDTLKAELQRRHVSTEDKKTTKQLRDALRETGSTEKYKELCDPRSHCPLDFQGCLDATTSGVFHAVALSEEALDNEEQPSGDVGDPCSLTLLEVLDKHAAVQKDKTVFASALPRALIGHSWRSYARRNVRRETLLYAAMVLCFSAAAIVSQLACSSAAASTNRTRLDEEETTVLLIHGAINAVTSLIAALLLLRLLVREVIQLRDDSLLEYMRDGWNCFQVPSYFVALASIGYHSLDVVRLWQQNEDPELDVLCDDSEQAKRELHAFAGGAVWLGALFYMRGFERTAVAVPIIRQSKCSNGCPSRPSKRNR